MGLCVSACLVSGYWLLFGIIFSKLFAWQTALEDSNDGSFQNKGKTSSRLIRKDSGSLSPGFLSCSTTSSLSRFSSALFVLPCGGWRLGSEHRIC